jgi:hypothetical protein
MEGLTMLGMLQCDEETEGGGDENPKKTVWRYSLGADVDKKTLLSMAPVEEVPF